MTTLNQQDPPKVDFPGDEYKVQPDTSRSTATDTESAEQKYEADSEALAPGTMGPAPDGGTRGWLVVLGSASIFFSCLGFMNSFGVFQEYYIKNQLRDQSPDNVAWIGSLMSFIQFFGGAISGPLFDRYGSWVRNYKYPRHLAADL